MTETQIRDAGMRIDVPFEAGLPVALKYRQGAGKQTWTPPSGWDQGAPPIDPQLAEDFGVPRICSRAMKGLEVGAVLEGTAGLACRAGTPTSSPARR